MGRKTGASGRMLSLRLLGPPEIRLGDSPFPGLPSRKTLALLLYLAVESSRSHDRSTLASLLWPDTPEERALASLRQSLLALRRILERDGRLPSFLEVDPRTVRFNPDSSHFLDLSGLYAPPSDCRVLEDPEACARCAHHLLTVSDTFRGPFLEGFSLPGCEEFENWVQGIREQVRTQADRIIERLIRFLKSQGNLPEALRMATLSLRIDPFDENGHRRLMRLLAVSGDPRAAELQFEACRNLLLRELGVPPDSETLALLKEIREGRTAWELSGSSQTAPPEHCPVTALFFDGLCDASSLSRPPSPELRKLCDRVPEFIRARGGIPVRSHGGTFLAWFGLGSHREGAARRAARTALELSDLFRREVSASVRAGLHAEMATAEGGPVPNLSREVEYTAMALCMEAGRGELVVSHPVLPLLSNQFRLEPASGRTLGDKEVFRLLGITDSPETGACEDALPLGREREIALFKKRWDSGRGGVIILEGPPGIGKTRLVQAFSSLVRRQRNTSGDELLQESVRTIECLPQYSDSPYFPLIRLLRNLIGIHYGQEEALSRERLGAYVRSLNLPDPRKSEHLLGDLIGIPVGTDLPRSPKDLLGASRREATEKVVRTILRLRERLLLIVEDLQWADDSTRQFLKTVLDDPVLSRRHLIVMTVRSEERPSWIDSLPGAFLFTLPPLSESDSRRMVQRLAGDLPLSGQAVEDLVLSSGGVPLFLKESFRMLFEAGEVADQGPVRTYPRTIDEFFSDRLSRYPSDRPLYQRAAVIGRVVSQALFRKISPESPEFLEAFLKRGIRSGLLRDTSTRMEESFEFCHVLFQEAAARSLGPEDRQTLHLKIGETLLEVFPHRAEATPELLGVHFEKGGRPDLAAPWYETAARRSFARGSFTEAERQARSALRLYRSLSDKERLPDRACARILVLLGSIRIEIEGLGRPDVGQIFQEASRLCRDLGTLSEESFLSLFGHFHVLLATGALAEAEVVAQGLADRAARSGKPAFRQGACFVKGQLLFHQGAFDRSLEVFSEPSRTGEPGADPAGLSRQIECYRALSLWWTGQYRAARERLAQIEQWASEQESPLRGFYLTMACILYRNFGMVDKVHERSGDILETADTQKAVSWVPAGLGFRGWALAHRGRSEGLGLILTCLPKSRNIHRVAETLYLSLLAEGYLVEGDGRRARGVADSAIRMVTRIGSRFCEAELWRLKGESERLVGKIDQAFQDFSTAHRIATMQNARALSLRAAVSWATLLCERSSFVEARALLEPFSPLLSDHGPWVPEAREAARLLRIAIRA